MDTEDIRIRTATPEDAEFLTEIRMKQLFDEGSEMIYDTRDQMTDFFRRKIADGSYLQLILEKDGVFASTAAVLFQEYPPSISWRGADRGYITSVYTAPEFRGRGYASMLLQKIIEETRARKLGNLWLLASRNGRNVYKKIGFDDERDGRDVYMEWHDEVINKAYIR